MLDILRDQLALTVTPERLDALESAHALLETLGRENYEQSFEELMVTQESEVAGNDTLADAAGRLTQELIDDCLRAHGIVLTEEATLEFRVAMLRGIYELPDHELTETFLATAFLDGRPEEVLSELLALVTRYASDEILVYMEEAAPSLLKRIQVIATPQDEPASDPEALALHVQKFEALRRLAGAHSLYVTELVQTGMGIGGEFSAYLTLVAPHLDEWESERAAYELLGIALLSMDGVHNPRSIIQRHLERLVSSIERTTAIDLVLSDYLVKIHHYEQA